uniref:Uncharacterized protein n=1 Tax=viral metagenome TaxID=1070528 RepID=A0A6C0DDG7_9ZZZZ
MNSSNVVSQIIFKKNLRIVSLPYGYSTEDQVRDLVENVLQIGKTSSVKVQQRRFNNAFYYSAFINFEFWYDSKVSIDLQLLIEENLVLDSDEEGEMPNTKNFNLSLPNFYFTWANGQPMNHISFKLLNDTPIETPINYPETNVERPLSESDWKSMYIPIIPDDLVAVNGTVMSLITPDQLIDIVQNQLRIGEVSRIDYVTSEPTDDKKPVKSAYVHFKSWYDNAEVESLRNELNTKGSKRYYSFGVRPSQYTFKSYDEKKEMYVNRYLVFKINHKPLQEAPEGLNVHQLHAANEFLNNLVKEKDEQIEAMKKEIDELNEKLALLSKTETGTETDDN